MNRSFDLELRHNDFEKDVTTTILDPRTPLLIHAQQPCDIVRVFRIVATVGGVIAVVFLAGWKLYYLPQSSTP